MRTMLLIALCVATVRIDAASAQAGETGEVPEIRTAQLDIDIGFDLEAHLDSQLGQFLGTIAKRAIDRTRRAFVLGPFVGGGAVLPFEGDADGTVSFGLGITKFDIPILPNRDSLVRAAKKRVLQRLRLGREPTKAEARQIADEIVAEIIAELTLGYVPRRFEKPSLATRLEGNYFVDSGAFDLRLTFAIGVSKVFLGSGVVLKVDDGAELVIPVELNVPMTLGKGKRSSLLDFFARIDFAVTDRDNRVDAAIVGARLHLDII